MIDTVFLLKSFNGVLQMANCCCAVLLLSCVFYIIYVNVPLEIAIFKAGGRLTAGFKINN